MKAIAVNGSPHRNGNTRLLLEAALEPLREADWETELLQLGGQTIHGCRACGKCREKRDRRCLFEDDVFNEFAARLFTADALILGSPTYFTDVTAEMKALLDRLGYVAQANGRLLQGRIGAAAVAVRRGGGTHVFDTINHMFLMSGVIVPGSTYWNLGFGLQPGDVRGDAEGLANMRHLGRSIAWLGAALDGRRDTYPGRDYTRFHKSVHDDFEAASAFDRRRNTGRRTHKRRRSERQPTALGNRFRSSSASLQRVVSVGDRRGQRPGDLSPHTGA